MLNNEQQILNWLHDDDILVLDLGVNCFKKSRYLMLLFLVSRCRNTLTRLRLQVAVPEFLHNQKLFTLNEANRTRFVTKTRRAVEGGRLRYMLMILSEAAEVINEK